MSIEYHVVFEEPWRIGSGEAAGSSLDSTVRKDPDGLPFVPGTTLRGIVGEALRELAHLLDVPVCDGTLLRQGGELGKLCGVHGSETPCIACLLVGSPHRPGVVSWEPAQLQDPDGDPDRDLARIAAAIPGHLTRHRNRTAIDPQKGRAEDDHLFTLEESRGRLSLQARLDLEKPLTRDQLALLLGALRHVRELGGSRRRGLGACRLHIDTSSFEPAFDSWTQAIEHLATLGTPEDAVLFPRPKPAPGGPLLGQTTRSSEHDASTPPVALEIEATVIGELALGRRPETGNLIPGQSFVPGSTLRGALASRWRYETDSDAFRQCFLSGAVRFGFLYPLSGTLRAQPTVLSRHTCKLRPGRPGNGGHGEFDLLENPTQTHCGVPGCDGRLVPWHSPFDVPELSAPLDLSSHNRIDRKSQTVRQGSLYAYETIPNRTRLRGYVVADHQADLERLLAGLGLGSWSDVEGKTARIDLRVGRRKRALGRLACTISTPKSCAGGVGLFPDQDPFPTLDRPGDLRIDLLTPAILLDELFRYRDLRPCDLGLGRNRFDDGLSRHERLSGWNSAQKLPKTEELALVAGSCWRLDDVTPEEVEVLRQQALRGVGRRRNEGFGAFRIRAIQPTPQATENHR